MTLALTCLALTVYFEARDQSTLGQLAVAQVVMERVESDRFPDTVCDVVKQGGDFRRYQCHFSWYCDGLSDSPTDERAWERAFLTASAALSGTRSADLAGVTHYHGDYVSPVPYWASVSTVHLVTQIGDHIFYTET